MTGAHDLSVRVSLWKVNTVIPTTGVWLKCSDGKWCVIGGFRDSWSFGAGGLGGGSGLGSWARTKVSGDWGGGVEVSGQGLGLLARV